MLRRSLVLWAACVAAALASPHAPGVSVGRLRADLTFLTSQPLGGRLSGEQGSAVAAQFIASEFAKAGLDPASNGSFFQDFPLIGYTPDRTRTNMTLQVGGRSEKLQYGKDFRVSTSRDIDVRGPIVFGGYGITAPEFGYDDYRGLDVTGKAVLVYDHEPQENDPASRFNGTGHTRYANTLEKAVVAQEHGAVALLIASEPLRTHRGLLDSTGPSTGSDGAVLRASAPAQALDLRVPRIPVIVISPALLEQLMHAAGRNAADVQRQIDRSAAPESFSLPGVHVDLQYFNSEMRKLESANVAGLLRGSDPALAGETVLITAHYDHLGIVRGRLYPGANDNGSGTVGVLELARLFAQSHRRPKRSLLFVVFGSEEELMLGSYWYTSHPLRPLATTRAVLNLDMIGRNEAQIPQTDGLFAILPDTSNELNLVGGFYSPQLVNDIKRADKKVGLAISSKFDSDHTLNVLFRCDHLPFLQKKVPAIWFFGGFHPGYHEPSDTVDKIDSAKLARVIQLCYLTAKEVGNTKHPPPFESGSAYSSGRSQALR